MEIQPYVAGTLFVCIRSYALIMTITFVELSIGLTLIGVKIVGSQIGLHPVVTLSSMFVGAQLFGVLGLFGFPIGLSLLRHLNDNGTLRVYKTGL